jgi:hypothetical protein
MDSSKARSRIAYHLKTSRQLTLIVLATIALAGCNTKPRFSVGDHLIPLGSSDPTQIVTVVTVEKDSYRVAPGDTAGTPDTIQTRTRREIDSYYVRVPDMPIGGSWTTPTPKPTPTPQTPAPTAAATATVAQGTPTPPPIDATKLAASMRSAVVRISFFDAADKSLRSGSGFFISADGRVLTAARNVDGAAKAVVEMASGAIKNVIGIVASAPQSDLAIIQADITGAPFLLVDPNHQPESDEQVVVVDFASGRHSEQVASGKIANVRADAAGDLLQVAGNGVRGTAGAPVLDQDGRVIAIVTATENGSALNSVRSISALKLLLAQINPEATATWPKLAAQSPTPTPTPKPRASVSPGAGGDATLVYTPYPRYPGAARFSYFGPKAGTGQYLIRFGADGAAMNVTVVRATGNQLLDESAVDALKSWRAQRGRPSQKVVPITFRP